MASLSDAGGWMGLWSSWFGAREQVNPTTIQSLADFRAMVLAAERPVILDVWGPGCPPCARLAPELIKVATRYAGKVDVAELNAATAERALLGLLDVRATPTIVVFENGEEFGRFTGYHPASWFDEMLAAEFPEVV